MGGALGGYGQGIRWMRPEGLQMLMEVAEVVDVKVDGCLRCRGVPQGVVGVCPSGEWDVRFEGLPT